jgi:hypothetical protein
LNLPDYLRIQTSSVSSSGKKSPIVIGGSANKEINIITVPRVPPLPFELEDEQFGGRTIAQL